MGLKSKATPETTPAQSPGGPPLPPLPLEPRGRAATASSASTATPPRLFDSDLALDNSELNDFGNMFEGIGVNSREPSPGQAKSMVKPDVFNPRNVRTRLITVQNINSSSASQYPPISYPNSPQQRTNRAPAPRPIYTSRNDVIDESPYSWTSQNSRDGLMRSPSPSKTITQGSPPVPAHAPFSVNKTRTYNRKPLPSEGQPLTKEVSHTSIRTGLTKSETFNSEKSGHSEIDPSFLESVDLANQWAETKPSIPKVPSSNKIMTPAQFEQYKKWQDEERRLGASRDSDSEDEINYDDDEEEEKERQAAKQRRKQEAHLTVYRQQMMKVTGEQSTGRTSSLGHTLDPRASPSPNALDNRMSHLTLGTAVSGKSSGEEEDEDEDVPLGILAAHGFPNRNRPPTQIMHSSSNPNLRALSQQQQQPQISTTAPSVAGESVKRGSLPVFARHLPTDPYYGASVVNPMNRESMAIHAQQQVPQGAGASTQHPLHPAGLVGVIAGEEKARAMRRGSPNAQGNFDLPPGMQHPGMMRSQTVGPGPMGMMPGMGGGLTPGDHAQIQMSQQMTQMMQMQMQWMQQMQQMMGGQVMSPGQMPMPPGFAPPPAPSTVGRPPTVHMSSAPQLNGRTMSTLTPSMASWNLGPQNGNYAASIAPSERSNIGLASRYRPVSTMGDVEQMSARRASTFTSTSVRPWSQMDLKPNVNARPSVSPVGRRNTQAVDDDDDDEGWAEMKAKKDKKQKSWKLRKGQNALQELYNGVP
jgi:hypothetical protein